MFDLIIILDYSTGFGGKYGVQKDRQDEVNIAQHYMNRYNFIWSLYLWFDFKKSLVYLHVLLALPRNIVTG